MKDSNDKYLYPKFTLRMTRIRKDKLDKIAQREAQRGIRGVAGVINEALEEKWPELRH